MRFPSIFAATTLLISSHFIPHAQAEVKVSSDVIAKIADGLPVEAAANPQQPRNVLIFSKTLGFRHG